MDIRSMDKEYVLGTYNRFDVSIVGGKGSLMYGENGKEYIDMGSGIAVALISPICAFLLKIAPNLITVLPIMVGNVCYVVILGMLLGKNMHPLWKPPVVLAGASLVKAGLLYLLVVQIVCGIASDALMGKKIGEAVLLAPKMLNMLPLMFGWTQLVTALCGGGIALAIVPALRKALHKQ